MNIPDEAVEAVARRNFAVLGDFEWKEVPGTLRESFMNEARKQVEAAAPHLMAEVERELTDAKRMIALLVLEAGGKVALSRRAITDVSDETVIETMQDVINGGWVIRARVPSQD